MHAPGFELLEPGSNHRIIQFASAIVLLDREGYRDNQQARQGPGVEAIGARQPFPVDRRLQVEIPPCVAKEQPNDWNDC